MEKLTQENSQDSKPSPTIVESSPQPPWTSEDPSRSLSPRSAEPQPTPMTSRSSRPSSTSVLTKHASAILLDPEFGLPASKHRNGKGLLLAYEKTGYDATTPGRLPDLLDVWSVRRLKEAGPTASRFCSTTPPSRNLPSTT